MRTFVGLFISVVSRLAAVALITAACAQTVSAPTPSPTTPSDARPTTLPPSSTALVSPTAVPTMIVSPAPIGPRLRLSDAALAADPRPFFLFRVEGEDQLRATAWSDSTNGVLRGRISSAGAPWWSSPDGAQYALNGRVYDREGRERGALPLPWNDKSRPTWSRDGRFLCKATPETPATGASMRLETAAPGQPARLVAAGYGTYGDNATYPVLACDATTDRAVVAAFGQGITPTRVWVFRLSTGALIRSEDVRPNAGGGSWLAASADGTLLAHTVRPASGPVTTTIRQADSGIALQTLSDFEGHGFSGDGSVLVGTTGPKTTALIDWKASRQIWSATGLAYGGHFAEPDGAHIAVGLGFVGGSNDREIYIVGPDGTSIILPTGVLASLHY